MSLPCSSEYYTNNSIENTDSKWANCMINSECKPLFSWSSRFFELKTLIDFQKEFRKNNHQNCYTEDYSSEDNTEIR